MKLFTDGGAAALNRTMHQATLTMLHPDTVYYYQLLTTNRSHQAQSDTFNFHTLSSTAGTAAGPPISIAMMGDYGLINSDPTHSSLLREANANTIDLIIHVGDIAYNMDDYDGTRGDAFMNREQPVISHIPYQVAPGNHEQAYNFSHYINRFAMPGAESGSGTNLYSSFNVGPVHFISLSNEMYFWNNWYSMDHLRMQYNWLVADLRQAQQHRHQQPWIVVYAHRPMYCTHIANDWNAPYCTENAASVRDGVAFDGGKRQYGWEQLFNQYQVDLFAAGHMHSYERTYPVYREQLINKDYTDNQATFYLVVGAAGCQEYLDNFDEPTVYPWSAARSDSYGYGKLTVYNATHMHWEQILDADGSTLDEVWVTKKAVIQENTALSPPPPHIKRVGRGHTTLVEELMAA